MRPGKYVIVPVYRSNCLLLSTSHNNEWRQKKSRIELQVCGRQPTKNDAPGATLDTWKVRRLCQRSQGRSRPTFGMRRGFVFSSLFFSSAMSSATRFPFNTTQRWRWFYAFSACHWAYMPKWSRIWFVSAWFDSENLNVFFQRSKMIRAFVSGRC